MAITNIRRQVVQDQRDKIILERLLLAQLQDLNRDIVQQYRNDMLRGEITRAEDFRPELEEMLGGHYEIVVDKFEGRIEGELPNDLGLTMGEQVILTTALANFFATRAIQQSRIITETTQQRMRTVTQLVASETEDQIERAVTGSVLLSQTFTSREIGTASLETQAAAEATKSAEFDVLAGKRPLSLERTEMDLTKEWVTVGDERVRSAHVVADSQTRVVNEPFNVGGQQLRWPGDTSFGASVGNVINCRCSSVYNTNALAANRIRRGQGPVFDTGISDALRVSLGG